jgi:cbb3-type cytochrome oxidase maturation protein
MLIGLFQRIRKLHAPRGSFIANVLTLMTGTTIAQAILITIAPILTRIYKPEDFGIFALYMAIVSMIAIIATGRYELAIMLPENDDDAINIVCLSVCIVFFISFMTLIVIWLFNAQITKLMGSDKLSIWIYLIPISVLLTGIYQAFNYWSNRKKQYKRLAISRIAQSTTTASVNLEMGFEGFGFSGLILGVLVGQGIATYVLGWQIWREDKDKQKLISKKKMTENMIKYKDFPRINSIHAFIDSLQTSGIVFLISSFFGNVILGFYSFTMRILQAPFGLIGSAFSQVFIQKASETYNNGGDLQSLVKKTMIRLSLIALPILIILVFFAPDIFTLIFGNNWREAGVYAQILSPWFFLNFISSPVSQVPLILDKQKYAFYIGIWYNLSILSSMLIGYLTGNIYHSLYAMSIIGSLNLLFYIYWIFKISKKYN